MNDLSTHQLVDMFEATKPLEIFERAAIMDVLKRRNPRMYDEWIASQHDSPRGYFLHGSAATAIRRPTPHALDGACESCVLELTPSCPIRTGNGCDLHQPRQ